MMLTVDEIKRGLKYSIAEGFFAHMYANLTGSIFLPAFALLLMAGDLTIGFLASIPFFATIAQILGSVIVEKYHQRKKTALVMALISRILWLPVIVLTYFLFDQNRELLLTLVIVLIIIHHFFGSVSGVAWLSWMSSLVPPVIRGRFFGLRNSFLGIVTIVATMVGGIFLDWYKISFSSSPASWSFMILFLVAVVAGVISTLLLSRQPDIQEPVREPISFRTMFSGPFQDEKFKKLIRFAMTWSFAVNFASPFYIVYMIRDLELSYTLVSTVAIFSALADLFGMGFWGQFSDKHGNRPVVVISATMGAVLPSLWIFTGNSAFSLFFLIPILHIAGGFFFAGYNLCSVNMLFGMVPRRNNSMFFAQWSMVNGIAAGLGAICGGLFSRYLSMWFTTLPFGWESVFKLVFLISSLIRLMSIFFLRRVEEPKGVSLYGAVRILRSVRTWTTTMGYHPLLQFFLPGRVEKENGEVEADLWPLWGTKDIRSVPENHMPEK